MKSWSLKLRLDMLFDYCLQLQSPCDDGLALDPATYLFLCDPNPSPSSRVWSRLRTVSVLVCTVRMDTSAECIMHLHILTQEWLSCNFVGGRGGSVLMTWKKYIALFYCFLLPHLPDPSEVAIVVVHWFAFSCSIVFSRSMGTCERTNSI